ncbi:MAG: glycoside hydrolase family 43 protein [Rhizobiaceae bacterium]|nr:glycoside hydrolase family 43 protein [Rhizobiaceae bacterium]
MIRNPILPGFNPDPSICRVGRDYYIATSTFEWYPGVQIHHSTDLASWKLVKRPLDRASQLDMRGNPDSGGIWAPCLSYADGLFWLVYTDVKRLDGAFKDTHNYIVTAPAIEGPWSDPVYVNSSGFDPSLFHDDDGRKWFMNMLWNHVSHGVGGQPKHPSFAGILLQEWDARTGKLLGKAENIFLGSPHGLVEGPHLFKRESWYYLTTAEGGTGYDHAVTMARSRSIHGPYEMHPDVHPITAKGAPDWPLQRAGHGQIVETPEGEFYHTHLTSRPLPGTRRSPLGRETAIQKCVWGEDGWLRLEGGGPLPALEVPAPGGANTAPRVAEAVRYDFDSRDLASDFQWLRTPYPDRLFSLTERPGMLRLHGRESIGSFFEQALLARRQVDFSFRAETELHFDPETFQQAAGVVHYYNRHKFHFACVTHDASKGRVLTILSCPGDWPDGRLSFPLAETIPLPAGPVGLAAHVQGTKLQFLLRGADRWNLVGPVLDASVISDEGGRGEHGSFTGAFVGMMAFDTSGSARPADFAYFIYDGRDDMSA